MMISIMYSVLGVIGYFGLMILMVKTIDALELPIS